MSVTAKQRLLKETERQLKTFLLEKDINSVLDILSANLSSYAVEEHPNESCSNDAQEMLDIYCDTKRLQGCSEKSITRSVYTLRRLFSALNVPVREITVFHIRSYLGKEKERGIADSTLEGNRSVYCSFFGWCQKEGLLKDNPCANLAPIKCAKKVKTPYSETDIEKLKEKCRNPRDKAIIFFLLATGCRISEACSLNRSDLDLVNFECKVRGKGNKERVVFFDGVTAMMLERYLNKRKDDCEALFINRSDERIQPGGVRKMLRQLGAESGVERVHPHKFRRTLATNLINNGMPIQDVAAVLGHDKLDTTMEYVYQSKENVRNSYRKYA